MASTTPASGPTTTAGMRPCWRGSACGGRTWPLSAPSSPARTCPRWCGPSTGWRRPGPTWRWSWPAVAAGAPAPWTRPWPLPPAARASCDRATCPTTPSPPFCARRRRPATRRWPRGSGGRSARRAGRGGGGTAPGAEGAARGGGLVRQVACGVGKGGLGLVEQGADPLLELAGDLLEVLGGPVQLGLHLLGELSPAHLGLL